MSRFAACATFLTCAFAAAAVGGQAPSGPPPATRPAPEIGWAPKRTPFRAYQAPNRAWWKLSDIRAMNRGKASWVQPIVRNPHLEADWHQLAPGGRTDEVMYPDNATAIIVWEGEVRVQIRGQEPFVATKGFEINVPFRVPFTMAVQGERPALWLEVHGAGDLPIYPVASRADKPKPAGGFTYDRYVLSGGPGRYEEPTSRPYLDFYKDVVGGSARPGAFMSGASMFVNNIRGRGVATPPSTNLGHFHFGYDEFWFIMEGNIDYQIEGMPVFTAAAGDVVIAAQGRFHRASFGGPIGQMDTRVAINPYPSGLHTFSVDSGGRQ